MRRVDSARHWALGTGHWAAPEMLSVVVGAGWSWLERRDSRQMPGGPVRTGLLRAVTVTLLGADTHT